MIEQISVPQELRRDIEKMVAEIELKVAENPRATAIEILLRITQEEGNRLANQGSGTIDEIIALKKLTGTFAILKQMFVESMKSKTIQLA